MSTVGPELKSNGSGLFHWFMNQKISVNGFSKVLWTGITTLELAKAIDQLIEQEITGLIHLAPKIKISKYDLLCLINEIWNRNINIKEDPLVQMDKSLINNRTDFNYEIPDYRTMLQDLYEWMEKNPFPQYNENYFQ